MNFQDYETITSLDMNFSNGSGGHTATITTTLGAKDLTEDEKELGSLIGGTSSVTSFTNTDIQNLMDNFEVVELTKSKTPKGITWTRKYQDRTSLTLKANCILVRGKDSHPKDLGASGASFSRNATRNLGGNGNMYNYYNALQSLTASSGRNNEQIMPYFGECANSPITGGSQLFPYKYPVKRGACIFVGNIYNEESSITNDGKKVSLVYQSKTFQPKLSQNFEGNISEYYKQNPDYANYNLKYGYTINELKSAFGQAGIFLNGLPFDEKTLYTDSGTLDSILSSVASKYGYYWYIDPFAFGRIIFINSATTSNLQVFDPLSQPEEVQQTYLNASYTKSSIRPKIVSVFSSKIEKQEQTFEFDQKERFTRFYPLDLTSLIPKLNVSKSLAAAFYGLHVGGSWSSDTFKVMAYLAAHLDAKGDLEESIDWGESWEDGSSITDEEEAWDDVEKAPFKDEAEKEWKHPLALADGKFIDLGISGEGGGTDVDSEDPSKSKMFKYLENIYSSLVNTIYVSHKFSHWKAVRMTINGSGLSISGPYAVNSGAGYSANTLDDVDALRGLNTLLVEAGFDPEDLKLDTVWGQAKQAKGNGDFGFIGVAAQNSKNHAGLDKDKFNFKDVNDKNFAFYTSSAGVKYLLVSEGLMKAAKDLIEGSMKMWNKVTKDKGEETSKGSTIKVSYTRGKKPVNEEESAADKDKEEEESSTQAGLNAIQERLEEIYERFDQRYFSINQNGAGGHWSNPVQLDIKSGPIFDIKKLEQSGISSAISAQQAPATSSRTLLGLRLPTSDNYSPTISGISFRLGASGITTTINESTIKMLNPAESLIIAGNGQAFGIQNAAGANANFSAGQRNFLKL